MHLYHINIMIYDLCYALFGSSIELWIYFVHRKQSDWVSRDTIECAWFEAVIRIPFMHDVDSTVVFLLF